MAPADDVLLCGCFLSLGQDDNRFDCFTATFVRCGDDADLLNGWMCIHQRLYLRWPDFEARCVDHALHTVDQEEVAFFIVVTQVA